MMQATMNVVGDKRFIRKMTNRAQGRKVEKQLVRVERWILKKRIPRMYGRRGVVKGPRGGRDQNPWPALSPWTREQKGSNWPMIPRGGIGSKSMARSYELLRRRKGLRAWKWVLVNRKQSEDGVDYPSILHSGAGPWTVKPKKEGGVLAWGTAKGGSRFFARTNPKGIPARPHIQLYRIDVVRMLEATNHYIMHGRRLRLRAP